MPHVSGGGEGVEGTPDVCASFSASGIVRHASDEWDEGQDRLSGYTEGQVSRATPGRDVTK